MDDLLDCVVIGAGPAGLTAAIYLARFHLTLRVIDAGQSRAALIPRTHNHAGYPGGIAGTELLRLMHEQATEFGVQHTKGLVETVERDEDHFVVYASDESWRARSVLLATGVVKIARRSLPRSTRPRSPGACCDIAPSATASK